MKKIFHYSDGGGNYCNGYDTVRDVILTSTNGGKGTIVRESGYCFSPDAQSYFNEYDDAPVEYAAPIEEIVAQLGLTEEAGWRELS